MFKNEGGEGVKGRLNNVQKTDDLVQEKVPKHAKEQKVKYVIVVTKCTVVKFIALADCADCADWSCLEI